MDRLQIGLRAFEASDAERVQCLLNDWQVSRYLTERVGFPYNLEHARQWVEVDSHQNPTWAIVLDGELVGCIGLVPESGNSRCAELGYWIGRDYWGCGIASATIQRVSDEWLKSGKFDQLTAGVFHPNLASMRVLQKCGFELAAIEADACIKQGKTYDRHLFVKIR